MQLWLYTVCTVDWPNCKCGGGEALAGDCVFATAGAVALLSSGDSVQVGVGSLPARAQIYRGHCSRLWPLSHSRLSI